MTTATTVTMLSNSARLLSWIPKMTNETANGTSHTSTP